MKKQDVLFMGHGSPMNAIEDNEFSRAHRALGKKLNRPIGIVTVSAHWMTEGTQIQASESPKIIYDFGGFPPELYQVNYPVSGNPDFAKKIAMDLTSKGMPAKTTTDWGCDHGIWTLMCHMFPAADVPCVQISLDVNKTMEEHFQLGKLLSQYREEGWLILCSGNIVHNLRMYGQRDYQWAHDFDSWVVGHLEQKNYQGLVHFTGQTEQKIFQSHPSLEHYVPLVYAVGAVQPECDLMSFPVIGFQGGSISMRSIAFSSPDEQ